MYLHLIPSSLKIGRSLKLKLKTPNFLKSRTFTSLNMYKAYFNDFYIKFLIYEVLKLPVYLWKSPYLFVTALVIIVFTCIFSTLENSQM